MLSLDIHNISEKNKSQQLKESVSIVLSRRTSKQKKEKGQCVSIQDSLSSSSEAEKT